MSSKPFRHRRPFAIALVLGIAVGLAVPTTSSAILSFAAPNALAVSGQQLGATTAMSIMRDGGNAVDAMVAMYAVISVTKPDMAGPAGGGWALIYHAKSGKVYALDMDTVTPMLATEGRMREAFRSEGWKGPRTLTGPMARGPLAANVPGNIKGWEAMLNRFGTKSIGQVLQPAIDLAEKGYIVSTYNEVITKANMNELSVFPTWMDTFTVNGKAPSAGDRMYRKNLAATLRKVAAFGTDVFYKGEIADKIDKYFQEVGGWIRKSDLERYNVVWSEPLVVTYTASDGTVYEIYGNPAPSSSIEVLETLKILDGYDLKAMGHNSLQYLHTVIEASKLAHFDNYRYVGDPKFVTVPYDMLLSDDYAVKQRARIDPDHAIVFKDAKAIYPIKADAASSTEDKAAGLYPIPPRTDANGVVVDGVGATTHSITADRDGNIVSMTNTLGAFYGSGYVIGDTGLVANNGMDWMDIEESPWFDGASPTRIEPGKRNRWTLAPVLIFKNGKPFMAIGGSGAETTAQGIIQPVLNVLEFGMDMQKAIDAPRFRWGDVYHYTGGQQLWLDVSFQHQSIPQEVWKGLAAKGHDIVPPEKAGLNPLTGGTNAVFIRPDSGGYMSGVRNRGLSLDWAAGY